MRIAYVILHIGRQLLDGGVGKKINSQFHYWCGKGHAARKFLLTPDVIELDDGDSFTFQPTIKIPVLKFVSREFSRTKMLIKLINHVKKYKPDIIYLRCGLYAFPLHNLFKIAPTVLEINTHDIEEYRLRGIFFNLINRLTRGLILRGITGIVAASHEIGNLPSNRIFRKPTRVISNGIDLDAYEATPAPVNKTPVVVFAGTPGFDWHGVDRLCDLARLCPDILVDIIGYRSEDMDTPVPENVRLLGYVHHNKVRGILAGADVACGTLAFYRKQMEEASPLKVREYLACGLPTILPYMDTDLDDLQVDFLLHIPNREDNVESNLTIIRDFIHQMVGKRVQRKIIYPRINHRGKEDERLDFFRRILVE